MPAPKTYWIPKNYPKGSVSSTTEASIIITQDNKALVTQLSAELLQNPNIVIPIEQSLWVDTEV